MSFSCKNMSSGISRSRKLMFQYAFSRHMVLKRGQVLFQCSKNRRFWLAEKCHFRARRKKRAKKCDKKEGLKKEGLVSGFKVGW